MYVEEMMSSVDSLYKSNQLIIVFIADFFVGLGGNSAPGGFVCLPLAGHFGFHNQQLHPAPHQPQPQPHFDPCVPYDWRGCTCTYH